MRWRKLWPLGAVAVSNLELKRSSKLVAGTASESRCGIKAFRCPIPRWTPLESHMVVRTAIEAIIQPKRG
jgi:hypothetical protein